MDVDDILHGVGSVIDDVSSKGKQFVASAVNSATDAADRALSAVLPSYGKGSGSTGGTTGNWKYPLTLDGTQHTSRIAFTATNAIEGDESDGGRSKAFGNYKRLKFKDIGTVFLYMPKISKTYSQNYTEEGRGMLWQMVNAFQNGGGMENLSESSLAVLRTAVGEIANTVAPGAIRDFSQTVKNQHLSATFGGTALRTQKFDFELRPRNPAELVQIAGLFKFFAANSATSLIQGDYLRVPSRWVIEEMCSNPEERIIKPFRFGPAYLTSVSIDYTPDGSWKTFKNGDPISFVLSLEFMEITIVTREEIEKLDL